MTSNIMTACTRTYEKPLCYVPEGSKVKLRYVHAGRCLQARLAAMGLLPGKELEVVRNGCRGPFIVAVNGSRMVLGKGIIQRMIVE